MDGHAFSPGAERFGDRSRTHDYEGDHTAV